MKVKRLLFLSKLSLLLLYVSAYSGESEYADELESELSGDSRSIDKCMPINKNKKNIRFGNQCTLESLFPTYVGQMDLTSSQFLTPKNFLCQSLLNERESKTFNCLAESFLILPVDQGNMRIKNVALTLRVKDTSYKNMEIKMRGSNESQVLKNADSYDLQVNLSLVNIQIENFLNQHFKVEYAKLKPNYNKLDELFPTDFNNAKLSALLNPYQYVEVILWPDDSSFFVLQKFQNSSEHSAGYFKVITTDSDKKIVQFKQNFQNKINEEFLKNSPECFSSCTSEISMIMSSKHRNLTQDFITEMNTVIMPKGATLRWRQTDHKSIKSVSLDQRGNGIVDKLPNEIGYSALFSQEGGMLPIKVYSYDNITGSFSDIINNFLMPSTTFDNEPYKSILQKRVVFKELVFNENSVSLNCEVDEDWNIVNNLVNLRGMNLTVELKDNNQLVSGKGDILVLGKMVVAKIKKSGDGFNLIGDFSVNNMNDLTSAARNVSFFPENENHKNFEHLKNLPLSSLNLATALTSDVLVFKGASLSYANAESSGSPSSTSLDIIVYNKNSNNLDEARMFVKICQKNVLFEKFFEEVLNVTLEGVPWLAFENLCFIIAKEKSNINTPTWVKLANPGIHFSGSISFQQSNCEREGQNIQDICYFIQNNSEIFSTFGKGKGSISQASFEFIAKNKLPRSEYELKENPNLKVKNPFIRLKEVFQKTYETVSENKPVSSVSRHHKKHTKHHKKQEVQSVKQANAVKKPDIIRMIGLSVEGGIEYIDSAISLSSEGIITSSDSGQLVLSCEDTEFNLTRESSSDVESQKPDRIVTFKAYQGKSIAKNNVFSIFDFAPQISIIFNERNSTFLNGHLSLNLANVSETYFSALTKSFENFKSVLIKFQLEKFYEESFIFAGLNFHNSSLLVWTAQDSVIVDASNRTARASILTLFGTANRFSKAVDFKMEIKRCFLRYEEWLPVLNVSNGNFKMFHKKDRSKGPKLKLNWNFCQKNFAPVLTGSLEIIGFSNKTILPIERNGHFKLENKVMFFNESKSFVLLQQEDELTSFEAINPLLHVSLIDESYGDESHIVNTVESHFKSLAEQFVNAYSGTFFLLQQKAAEDLLYNPAKSAADALEPVSNMIENQILKLNEINSVASQDCIETCRQSIVKIPGIDVQQNAENNVIFNLNPEDKEAVNVTCIADCEIKKSVVTKDYDYKVNEIKKLLLIFDQLDSQVKEIHNIYTKYESVTRLHTQRFNKEKVKYDNLSVIMDGINSIHSQFFRISKFEIKAKLAQIVMQGDNCVENFQASYTMFEQPVRNFQLCQCFNGEYATYFAKKVAENYFGNRFDDLDEFYKFHSSYVASQEENLNLLETSLVDFYKKYENAPVQSAEQSSDQRFVVEHKGSQHHSIAKDLTDYLSRQTLTFYTRSLDLPQITSRNRALLEENQVTITRSMKTKKAFLYSSPWAALSAFDPESSFKKAEVVVRALPSNKSHCNAVTEAGNQYVDLYKSIRSISDSYSQTIDQLNGIFQSMQRETSALKEKRVGTSNETTNDQLYWIRQLEKGTQFFSDLIKKKLSKYSANALTSFKSKFESALKRNGVRNINRFVRQLKQQLQWIRTSSSTKRTKGLTAASKLSDEIVALFKNPKLKLDEATNRIKVMETYLTNINGMVRTCRS